MKLSNTKERLILFGRYVNPNVSIWNNLNNPEKTVYNIHRSFRAKKSSTLRVAAWVLAKKARNQSFNA